MHWSYDEARHQEALEAARDALLAVGDTDRASEAESFLARMFWDRGEHDHVREHLARAEELAGDSVSVAAARVLAFSGRIREIAGETEEGRKLAEAAFAMATELGLDELRAHSLATIGMAKNAVEDGSGVGDMERALDIALAADSPVAAAITNNLAVFATYAGDFPRTDELYAEAARLAERFGDAASARFIRGNRLWIDFMLGRWDRALERRMRSSPSAKPARRIPWRRLHVRSVRRSHLLAGAVTGRFGTSCARSSSCGRMTRSSVSARSRLRQRCTRSSGASTMRGSSRLRFPGLFASSACTAP